MKLQFTNQERTACTFGNESFGLIAPEDWDSIGNGPTKEAVKAWLAEGNTPEEYAPPAPAPICSVTMRQARLALLQAGLLQQIDDAINQMQSPDKEAARIEWEYSQEVHREKALAKTMAQILQLTEDDINNLFELAASL